MEAETQKDDLYREKTNEKSRRECFQSEVGIDKLAQSGEGGVWFLYRIPFRIGSYDSKTLPWSIIDFLRPSGCRCKFVMLRKTTRDGLAKRRFEQMSAS